MTIAGSDLPTSANPLNEVLTLSVPELTPEKRFGRDKQLDLTGTSFIGPTCVHLWR